MTVGLALRANPQAPFERTPTCYHEKNRGAGKAEPAQNSQPASTLSRKRAPD